MSEVIEPSIERVDPAPADGVILLAFKGELDLAMHGRFHDLVDEVVAERPRLVVADLTDAEFMDSTMLRELLRAHNSLQDAESSLIVAAPQAPIQRLFELTGTDAVLSLVDSRDAALAN